VINELKDSVKVVKEGEMKIREEMDSMMLKIRDFQSDIDRIDEKDAQQDIKIEDNRKSILSLSSNVYTIEMKLKSTNETIAENVSRVGDTVKKLGEFDAKISDKIDEISDKFENTDENVTTMGKTIFVMSENIKVLRERETKTTETVIMMEQTIDDLRSTVKRLDKSDKKNVETISTMGTVIDSSLKKIQDLEETVRKLEQHSTKVLVVSIERIDNINKMLTSDVEHLNECLRNYEARPDKVKGKWSHR
jgi:chromosome segregation ATPase